MRTVANTQQISASDGYRALTGAFAWHWAEGRGLFAVLGEDRTRFVNAMFTGDVRHLKPGGGCYAFSLDARGRIVSDAWLFVLEDSILIDTEPESEAFLFEHLEQHLIGDDAEIRPLHPEYHSLELQGPGDLAELFARAGWAHGEGALIRSVPNGWMTGVTATGLPGVRLWLLRTEAERVRGLFAAEGIVQASAEDIRVARLECGRPRFGEELSSRFLGPEANVPGAIAVNKGCYLGQEVVERIRSRNLLGRSIVVVSGVESDAGAVIPNTGVKLVAEGRRVGELLSATYSPRKRRAIGLACIQAAFIRPGQVLVCEDHSNPRVTLEVASTPVCDASHGFFPRSGLN